MICAFVTTYIVAREVVLSEYIFAPTGVFYCRPTLFVEPIIILGSGLVGLPLGFVLANVCIWIIRYFLQTLDNVHSDNFHRMTKPILRFSVAAIILGVPILLLVSNRDICFTDQSILYRPFAFLPVEKHDLSEIGSVKAVCSSSKSGFGIAIVLETRDSLSLQINEEDLWQPTQFKRILKLLHNVPFNNSGISSNCPGALRTRLDPITSG